METFQNAKWRDRALCVALTLRIHEDLGRKGERPFRLDPIQSDDPMACASPVVQRLYTAHTSPSPLVYRGLTHGVRWRHDKSYNHFTRLKR